MRPLKIALGIILIGEATEASNTFKLFPTFPLLDHKEFKSSHLELY